MYFVKKNRMRGLEDLLIDNDYCFFIIDSSKKKLLFELFGYDSVLHISRFAAIMESFPFNGRLFICFLKLVNFNKIYNILLNSILFKKTFNIYAISLNGYLLNWNLYNININISMLCVNIIFFSIVYIYVIITILQKFLNSFKNLCLYYCQKKC